MWGSEYNPNEAYFDGATLFEFEQYASSYYYTEFKFDTKRYKKGDTIHLQVKNRDKNIVLSNATIVME